MLESLAFAVNISQKMLGTFRKVKNSLQIDHLGARGRYGRERTRQ